jgi:hypothetical protein
MHSDPCGLGVGDRRLSGGAGSEPDEGPAAPISGIARLVLELEDLEAELVELVQQILEVVGPDLLENQERTCRGLNSRLVEDESVRRIDRLQAGTNVGRQNQLLGRGPGLAEAVTRTCQDRESGRSPSRVSGQKWAERGKNPALGRQNG